MTPASWSVPRVPARDELASLSALFAYKLNWQSVLFVGYGEDGEWSPVTDDCERAGRSFFLKLAYAFQR